MQFTKMATDCLTAVVASSGFLVVAAATAIEVQKKKKENGRFGQNLGYYNGQ